MLLGEIVEKDGAICLQTSPRVWYPLEGSSGIANDFRETFNRPQRTDIGRRLYRVKGALYLETIADAAKRKGSDFPRIAAQGERYTYWEVSQGVFNVSPDATGGYASPHALAQLKGDTIKGTRG